MSGSNYCKLTNNFTLSSLDINNPFGTRGQLGINFSNARITYSTDTGYHQRRYNTNNDIFPPTDITSNIIIRLNETLDINCNVTYTLSNLLPDVRYKFNVAVNTTGNSNYSIVSSNSEFFKTLLPPYPPRLTTVTQCNDGLFYARQGFNIGTPTVIFDILCNASLITKGGLCNIINNRGGLAILTDNNPRFNIFAGQAAIQANITVTCGTTDLNIFILRLWDTSLLSGSIRQSNASDFSVIHIGTQQQDPYADNPQLSKFYLQASNVSVIIRPTFLKASNVPYSYSITHSNINYPNITSNFNNIYVDNLTQLTSVISLTNTDNNNYNGQYITGLFSLSNNQTFNFNLNLLNFASNFLPACNTLVTANLSVTPLVGSPYTTASIALLSNTTIYNEDNTPIAIGSAAPGQVRLKLSNLIFQPGNNRIFLTSNTQTQISANLTIENLVGTSTHDVKIPYYFDTLSLSNLTINHNNSTAIGGARHVSFSNSYRNDFIQFDNSQKIYENSTCNIYNNELPLVEGSYRTGGAIGSRFDSLGSFILPSDGSSYPSNYSQLKTETQVRYATFKYSLSNSSNVPLRALEFNMKTAGIFSYIGGINCNFNPNQVPTLFYKIDNVGGSSVSPINTGWLNGNTSLSSEAPLTLNKAGDGSNGLLPNSDNFPITDIRRYWNIISIPANNSYDVYIKIGLQMACNLYFDYMYLQSKYLDLGEFYSPSNLQFEVITRPRTVKITWSNIPQNNFIIQKTGIRLNNISDYTYPRRFVGASSRYIENLVTDEVIAPTTEYVRTLSNSDTYYNIVLSNIATGGKISSNISFTNKTDLPPYGFSNFYNENMIFKFLKEADGTTNIYFTNTGAYYFGNPRVLVNNIIRKQALSIKLVNNNGEYVPFIINYSNPSIPIYYPGTGLSNFILYININGSIASHPFSNEQYSNNIGTFGRTNNNVTLNFTNAGDITTDMRDTGFFYKSALEVRTLNTLIDGSNTITLSNNFGNSYQESFFIESLTTSPIVNKMFVDTNGLADPAYYTYVSGVLVFRTVNAPNYNFWMQTSNLNSKFIMPTPITFALTNNSGKISELNVNGLNVAVYSAANTGSVLTNSFVNANNNTFFSWPNVSLTTLTNIGPANTLSLVGTASNLSGGSVEVTQQLSTESGGLLYFDNESLRTIALTTSSNFINNTTNVLCNWGYRVTSGSGLYPAVGTFDALYNNTVSLLAGSTYSNELQLANGYFTTCNSFTYLNYGIYYNPISGSYTYPNYTSITTDGGIRWTTFMWNIAGVLGSRPGSFATIIFNDHNLKSISNATSDPPETFFKFNDIIFNYRIIGLRSNAITTRSSGWLDGNTYRDTTLTTADTNVNTNGVAGGVSGQTGTRRVQPNSNTRFIRITNNEIGNNRIGVCPYLLYIRLGIPINCNIYFKNIQLSNMYN
jgi:hypothetical protein